VLKRGFIFSDVPFFILGGVMVLACPKCNRQIRDEDAVYCPYCSNPLSTGALKRTDFPIAGGVLLIIAASVCVFVGIVSVGIFFATSQYMYYPDWRVYYLMPRYENLLAGAVGILAFVYGLAAGILSLKRRKFVHCLFGGSIMACEGVLIILVLAQQWPSLWVVGLLLGLPVVVLSASGLLFVSVSREEFR